MSYLFSLAHFPQLGVDRICHWYQSLLNLPLRAQKMKVLGKEQDEGQRKPRKGKNISLKKTKKGHCYPLTLSVFTFLCDAFAFLLKGNLWLYQGAANPLQRQEIQKGQFSLWGRSCAVPAPPSIASNREGACRAMSLGLGSSSTSLKSWRNKGDCTHC